MAKVMLTVTGGATAPSLDEVVRRLALEPGEIDRGFGVVPTDPARGLYAVLVEEAAAARVAGAEGVEGPYSNPAIEPFGPPEG